MTVFTSHDVTNYIFGFFGTGLTALIAGVDTPQAAGLAVILPALVLLFVNIPKFVRECVLLYRELKNDPQRDQDEPFGS
jgi:hypothetical protein